MKRALMPAVAFAFFFMLPEPLAAQDLASSIVGTWKLTSFVRKEGDGQDCHHVRGAPLGVRLLHEGWPLPYLRGGARPQKEREGGGPHGRGTC